MIEFKTRKPRVTVDGVTFAVPAEKVESLQNLANTEYIVTIKRHREKRSLDANAYAWCLINAIANETRASKEDVYFEMLKRYGQGQWVSVKSEYDITGYIKHFEIAGYGTVNGVEFTHYKVYKGSSEFNTKEMSIFIDGIVSEAQDLGIDTRTPSELAELKSLWESEK